MHLVFPTLLVCLPGAQSAHPGTLGAISTVVDLTKHVERDGSFSIMALSAALAPAVELRRIQLLTQAAGAAARELSIEVKVHASETVAEVKARLELEWGIPRGEQTLLYEGQELANARTLAEYEVRNDAQVKLLVENAQLREYRFTVRNRGDGRLGPLGVKVVSMPAPSYGDPYSARELQSRLEMLITTQWPAFEELESYEKKLLYVNPHDSGDELCGTDSELGSYEPSLVNRDGKGEWVSKRFFAKLANVGNFTTRRAWTNNYILRCGEFWIGEEEVICQPGRYREPNCEHTDEEAEWGGPRTDNFISMEGIKDGLCIDMKCYDATTLRGWLHEQGTVPHNLAAMPASALDALLRGSLVEREAAHVPIFREG